MSPKGGKRAGAGRKRMFDDPRRIAIVLPRDLYARLVTEAERRGTKPSTLARELIDAALPALAKRAK